MGGTPLVDAATKAKEAPQPAAAAEAAGGNGVCPGDARAAPAGGEDAPTLASGAAQAPPGGSGEGEGEGEGGGERAEEEPAEEEAAAGGAPLIDAASKAEAATPQPAAAAEAAGGGCGSKVPDH